MDRKSANIDLKEKVYCSFNYFNTRISGKHTAIILFVREFAFQVIC